MKIGILGDIHYTNRAPRRRIDDYFQTQLRKSNQALTIFEEMECDIVIQPGDFFDSPAVADRVKSTIITLLKGYGRKIYCVWGQHDITGHSKSTLPNSPLAVLEAAEVVEILDNKSRIVGTVDEDSDISVCLYGAGFGEDIPEPYEDCYNILVAHRMVGDRPLWPDQELIGPREFLRKHTGYNICIFGDYHYRFSEKWNGRIIVNVGALVRKTVSKFDLEHRPAVGVFDTSTNEVEIIELDVKPVKEILDLTKEVKGKGSNALVRLVERLKEGSKKLIGWKSILLRVYEERKSCSAVKEIIDSTLEELNG
jgi:predicted phosphodiesterase